MAVLHFRRSELGAAVPLRAPRRGPRRGPERLLPDELGGGGFDDVARSSSRTGASTGRCSKSSGKSSAYRGEPARGGSRCFRRRPSRFRSTIKTTRRSRKRSVTTNDFGSAAGEFSIPAAARSGRGAAELAWRFAASVRVEEYKRPTFEVSFKDPPALRLNRAAKLTGEARYYFGLPVPAARCAGGSPARRSSSGGRRGGAGESRQSASDRRCRTSRFSRTEHSRSASRRPPTSGWARGRKT